jgi:hypothetical protein
LIKGKKAEAPERAGELGADIEPLALLLLPVRLFTPGFTTGVLERGAKPEITSIPEITSMVPSNHPLLLLLLPALADMAPMVTQFLPLLVELVLIVALIASCKQPKARYRKYRYWFTLEHSCRLTR